MNPWPRIWGAVVRGDWIGAALPRQRLGLGELWPWNGQVVWSPAALREDIFSAASSFQLSVGHGIPWAAQPGAGPWGRLFVVI